MSAGEQTRIEPGDALAELESLLNEANGEIVQMVAEVTALLQAIDEGQLLAAAPVDPQARQRHETATCLLTIAHDKMRQLSSRVGVS